MFKRASAQGIASMAIINLTAACLSASGALAQGGEITVIPPEPRPLTPAAVTHTEAAKPSDSTAAAPSATSAKPSSASSVAAAQTAQTAQPPLQAQVGMSTAGAIQVPLFALLSNPDKFDGKLVTTQGFMHFRDEDYELYPSKEFGNFRLSLDGLWLDFSRDEHRSGVSSSLGVKLSDMDDKYVNLTGVFDTKVKGRFNFSIGGFRGISQLTLVDTDKAKKVTTTSTEIKQSKTTTATPSAKTGAKPAKGVISHAK